VEVVVEAEPIVAEVIEESVLEAHSAGEPEADAEEPVMGPLTAEEASVEAVVEAAPVEAFNADAPDAEPRISWEAESEEWEPVAAEELLTDEEAFVAEPASEVDQPSAETENEDAEPWFVADVQEPAAPAEPAAPQTDTWSGRAIGS
jgi:hypothetical protein